MENSRSVEQIEEKGRNKCRILLNDGVKFILYKGEIRRFHLQEGSEFTEEMYLSVMFEILLKRGKNRALYLLQSMNRTKSQVRDKLKTDEYPDNIIDLILEFLEEYHYLNDRQYAERYIESKKNSMSLRRIRAELIRKGINADLIDASMANLKPEELEQDEMELLLKLICKKHKDISHATLQEKQKLYAFLARRGFSHDRIMTAMRMAEGH